MKINKNKFLYGGENSILQNGFGMKQIQTFISLIIIGYFAIKIIYGVFFGYYPEKFYYKDITINTNEQTKSTQNNENSETKIPVTKEITLNAYVPGMWNNEMTDFISMLVLTFVIFVFTNASEKSLINQYGNMNFAFLAGYIIGLGYPPIYNNYIQLFSEQFKSSCTIRYMYLVSLVGFISFIVVMNYSSANKPTGNHRPNYLIYVIVIVLLFIGLIFSRKNSKNYTGVTYSYKDENGCRSKEELTNNIIQSSGDLINITSPFVAFMTLLFFSYEPEQIGMKNLYIFIYGILLGILVSGISYFGIEFFLVKKPEKTCNNINECIISDYAAPSTINNNENASLDSNQNQKFDVNRNLITDPNIRKNNMINNISFISGFKISLIILIILVSSYLIYFFMKSGKNSQIN